jgi:hypothetical protein
MRYRVFYIIVNFVLQVSAAKYARQTLILTPKNGCFRLHSGQFLNGGCWQIFVEWLSNGRYWMYSPRHGRPFGIIPTTIEQVVASREIGVSSRIILHFQRSSISRQFSSMLHSPLFPYRCSLYRRERCCSSWRELHHPPDYGALNS